MPLHGKIVVIKRSGVDGTEFPLTATCLFGRKPDCDIRIQLPQVSKEHCRIDLNENKEIILTNLSSVNPTRVNGEALQQSERLKHGDVITVIDRSFRFEYPPPPTPKKRSSIGGKTETLKVLQNQQVGDTVATETGEKRISEVSTDPHLKDGTNHDNIQRPLEKTVCVEAKEDDGLLQSKKASPFNDLYQMIKKSLDVKTPRKSSASVLQTPSSKFCTPKPCSVRKNGEPVISTEDKSTPKKEEAEVFAVADEIKAEAGNVSNLTPKSVKKQRKSFQVPSTEMATSEAEDAAKSEATSPQKRIRTPPKRFTAGEVVEQSPKSPVRRRSKEAKPAVTQEQEEKVETVKVTSKKRKSEELGDDLPTSQMKRKRVSFGGVLCPELFDKRLPPDSPLRKGAAPRRSLAVAKPKQSLLRRASASGLLQDKKERSCSPKMRTPSPGKKSPKSRTPSPKAATAAKKSPKSKSPSPTVAGTPGDQTPKVQGRFSVSHISTPSPVAEDTDQVPLVTATPKVSLRRRSTSRETPGLAKSAAKVMRRRGGISRASMKVKNSWADIVRFGQTKALVVAPAKKTVISKMMKKTVSKPQTPARKPIAHVSTGHADSPVTIVVGRAHKQTGLHPTGAAPKLVTNIALFKKNMEMDEDLTGISEMLKTPVNEMRKRSVINENNAPKTPVGGLGTSVLNTPEETGEMMVSPLSVSSTVKDKSYNSEAVQRLFDDNNQESSTVIETPAVEDSSEQQCTDLKTASVATPNQKPELPVCVTGVKRIMKTPKQKTEPIEDLGGKILKTPKQKPVQQECLTGVKRIMKTPKQKAEPIEDLRGKILKTPKQKPEQQECLTGVKRMMTTPKREAEPVEDIKVELMTTPEQKPEQQECLTEVEIVCKTPQPESEPLEDQGKALETPKALEAGVTTPEHKQESEDLTDVTAENLESSSLVAVQTLPDCDEEMAKELVFAQEEQQDDVPTDVIDDVPQVNSKQEADANEVAVDDHLEELSSGHDDNEPSDAVETIAQAAVDENVCVEKTEEDTVDEKIPEEQPTVDEKMPEEQPTVDEKIPEEQPTVDEKIPEEQPTVDEKMPEEQPTVDEKMPEEQPTVDEKMPEEQPEVEAATIKVTEMEQTATDPDQKKSLAADDKQEEAEHCEEPVAPTPVRGRRGKKTEATAPPAVRQTPRGRKAKSQESPSDDQPEMAPEKAVETTLVTEISTEAVSDQTSPINENDSTPAEEEAVVKPTKGRKTRKTPVEPTEDVSDESPETSIPALEKPKRGRKPKPDAVEQNEVVEDTVVAVETKQQSQPPVRAKRGRNAKQEEEKPESTSVETTKPQEPAKKVRKTRKAEQASEDQPEMIQEVVTEAEMVPEPESQQSALVDVDHEASDSAAPLEKAVVKPKRGRKVKQPEPSVAEQQDVPSSHSEDVPQADMTEEAPVRGRRGKKTEATAPPAVRQKTRGRNTKSQESPSDDQPEMAPEKAVETTLVTETSTMKENESAPAEEEAVVKPTRGRKSKQTPVEPPQPEQSEDVSDESLPADAQPQKSIPALEKPKRGRKLKPDAVEQNEVVEVVAQPPVRAKRGRNAKQEEEKPESTSVETTKSQEPAKKIRKTRKAEQALVEAREEVQSIEMVVPEEAEAPLVAEPVKMKEPATVAAKPKRAGRKATEVQEVPAASSTDKLKRGTRGKRVTEEGGVESVVPEEKPEHEVDAEQGNNAEPDAPVIKQSRARGAKTSVKNEVSQAIPAKKARRGAALPLEETNAESTVLVSEPASSSVKPAKRGRRAADDAPVTSEVSSKAVVEDTKTSKRAVKWKADCEVFEVPEATPVKAVRGKKSKIGSKVDTESKNVPKDAGKTEEKDLSDKVGEAQPVKKTRRGAKVADVTADEAESTSEADAQPKTRRGRTSKK